ncbi:MAG: CDGSH iron-sulfur domain-containing protein [Anaerolineae bacterium]|nr:CDGSH iron-sulfur domain-containing protein [Anaerolineae bacterium]
MTSATDQTPDEKKRIVIRPNGSYRVEGKIPLVRKTQVVSEYGEPLTWKKEETIETGDPYFLCRCGGSKNKPFCDSSHKTNGFDGTETADTRPTKDRQVVFEGEGIVVKRDHSLCSEAGFCGSRFTHVEQMTANTGDTQVRSLVMAMIERCPSGSFAYSIQKGEPDVEPDLPQQIAVTTEITSDGPIPGPLWVTGNIPIERSDGQPFETRNRVTLCNCGRSRQKPLCDGTHRTPEEKA